MLIYLFVLLTSLRAYSQEFAHHVANHAIDIPEPCI